jgi:hypothetical protein
MLIFYPMGESNKRGLRVYIDGKLCLEFHGATVTSDAELLAYRELLYCPSNGGGRQDARADYRDTSKDSKAQASC